MIFTSNFFYTGYVLLSFVVKSEELIREFVLDCVLHQFSRRAHMHFVQNSRAVGAHGGRTKRQRGGDFFRALALTEEAKNLKLAIRELVVQVRMMLVAKSLQKKIGSSIADVNRAAQNLANGLG